MGVIYTSGEIAIAMQPAMRTWRRHLISRTRLLFGLRVTRLSHFFWPEQSMRTVGKMWLNLDIWVLQGRGCGRARRKIAMAASFRRRTSERSHSQGKLLSCVPMCGLG